MMFIKSIIFNLFLISYLVSLGHGYLHTIFECNWMDANQSDLLSAIDEPNSVVSSNNELACAVDCLVQLTCTFFNYIESESRCELFQYQPINYEVLPGFLPNKKFDSMNTSCPTPGSISKFPRQCCALPFTLNGGLFYGCIQNPSGAADVGCFLPPRVWVTCGEPSNGYIATNQTVNLTIPTFLQPTLVTSVNNWIVMQQRIDLTSFNLAWPVFKSGFGTLNGNFWLGLEKVYQLTKSSPAASLRIEMLTTTGKWFSTEYAGFILDSETNKYAIHLAGVSGDAGDVMSYHNEMKFTTTDSDNDLSTNNCAVDHGGGFWYNACMNFDLNGDSSSYYGWLNGVQYYFSISRMMFKIN